MYAGEWWRATIFNPKSPKQIVARSTEIFEV
jgi:hypothetical protein